MRCDQFNASRRQLRAQRITIKGAIGNDTLHFLTSPSATMWRAYADRRERFFREPNLVEDEE